MFPQLVFSESVPEHMLRDILPAPVLLGRQYRRPSITIDEWREMKRIFDEKESEWSCHAPISLEAEHIRRIFLKYLWTTMSGRNLIGARATTQTWDSLLPLQLWTKLEDVTRRRKMKIKYVLALEPACGSMPMQCHRRGERI